MSNATIEATLDIFPEVEATLDILPEVEVVLGTITLLCFLIGAPGNLLATIYFVQEHLTNTRNLKKLYFTELYMCMTTVDFILTVTLFPIFENYFTLNRNGQLFHNSGFCIVWGAFWEIAPCISVFLVGILSISRMLILVKPMQALNPKHLRCIIGGYSLYHVIIRMTLWFVDDKPTDTDKIYYTKTTGYCYFYPQNDVLWKFNAYHAGVVLGLVIIPIALSFFTSLLKLRESTSSSATGANSFSRTAQRQASVTIVIVTLVYLVCNLPVFLNYTYYTHIIMTDNEDYDKYYSVYSGSFWGHYVWNLSYCVLVALNAMANPVVFYLRMKPFRDFVKAILPTKNSISHARATHMPGKPVVTELTSSSF